MYVMPGRPAPAKTKYLFIDGGCLRAFSERSAERYEGFSIEALDWSKVAAGFEKVFYYDAPPARTPAESDADFDARLRTSDALFNRMRLTPGFHVYEGDTRRRRGRVQQKKVDILIAVDMLTHAFRRNMDQATILTADLDFTPLIDALVQSGMDVTLWYPRGQPNAELVYAADRRRPLTYRDLFAWTSKEFGDAHPVPSARSEPGSSVDGGVREDEWQTASGEPAVVYRAPSTGVFTVVFPSRANKHSNHHIRAAHSDKAVLEQYVRECFDEFWDAPL
jgi:uncharacterized LabA/DUF88 family protein